ncbi:MAG: hypothetical protein V1703_00390 [Candidatus Altiarchaeota archaeon]
MKLCTATAFPGLPIIFAEGYREGRVSMHGHISISLTSVDESVKTETTVEKSGESVFLVDGKPLDDGRGKGMLELRDIMLGKSKENLKLKIHSKNHGILSGSSDSGAAALTLALDKLLNLNLSINELHEIARHGSETAYRSLYGGLSEYYLKPDGTPHARELLHAQELKDISICAIPFEYPRHSADALHLNVVKHPEYKQRILDVGSRIHEFKGRLVERDFSKCLQLMEDDAKQVHKMFEDVGFTVRQGKMLELCNRVEQWRKSGLECYWNVAGGSVVYVFTTKRHRLKLMEKLHGYQNFEYKVAGPALVV